MVRLIVGKYGSGKLSRAERLAKRNRKSYMIYELYEGITDEKSLLTDLQRSRDEYDVYIVASSISALREDFFDDFVEEYHIYENDEWKIHERKQNRL